VSALAESEKLIFQDWVGGLRSQFLSSGNPRPRRGWLTTLWFFVRVAGFYFSIRPLGSEWRSRHPSDAFCWRLPPNNGIDKPFILGLYRCARKDFKADTSGHNSILLVLFLL
jgi:hypothetical protein